MTGYSSYLCFDYEAITTSKLKSLIVQQIKSFFTQVVRRVFEDSGNTFRTSVCVVR